MIALVPKASDANRLAVAGYEPSNVLHVTLRYLGALPLDRRSGMIEVGRALASKMNGPIEGNVWASASLNPTGPQPCAAYLVGGIRLELAHGILPLLLGGTELPADHHPWVPHITIGYDLDNNVLDRFGPVTFDRVRVAFGEDNVTDFML